MKHSVDSTYSFQHDLLALRKQIVAWVIVSSDFDMISFSKRFASASVKF